MLPPIHISGVPGVDWMIFALAVVLSLYWLRALRLAREGARRFLRDLLKAIMLFCGVMMVFSAMRPHLPLLRSQELVVAGFLAMISFGRLQGRKRSRRIPKSIRRTVIERDLKGEMFDPHKHQIDHVWPFSRGGSNTVDNLRVIEKKKNLRKGAKRPRMREMW